jgi:8-oxo-dGTP pyrophosphatase MutT (NUDIX family)
MSLRLCALREAFEESGIVPGIECKRRAPGVYSDWRNQVHDDGKKFYSKEFGASFSEFDVQESAKRLFPVFRIITPVLLSSLALNACSL